MNGGTGVRRAGDEAVRAGLWPALLLSSVLAACSSLPSGGDRDGPPASPPPDLSERPDAEPRIEPLRVGGPNKPYVVLGQAYTPMVSDEPLSETGLASWYGRKFHGRPTSSGEIYDMYAMTAAHRTMPIPSYALVRNPANAREVVVRINDRGPFHADRVIDLSYAAALKLGVLKGVAPVQVQRLTHDDIRTGRWGTDTARALAAASPSRATDATSPPMPVATAAADTATDRAAPVVAETASTPLPHPVASGTVVSTTLVANVAAQAGESRGERDAVTAPAPGAGRAGYWVQLGAFRQRQGANDMRRQVTLDLAWLEPWLTVFDDSAVYRLQAGPFASRKDAQSAAQRIRDAARVEPMVVLRR